MAKIEPIFIIQTSAAAQEAVLAQILYKSTETAIDISGATITFNMVNTVTRERKINASGTGVTITDAANGKVKYDWQAGDLDTPGVYHVYFHVTPASGNPFTFPQGGPDYGGPMWKVTVTSNSS